MSPPASYSFVGAQTYPKPEYSAFYSHFQVTSGQTMSLTGHLWSREVCDVIFCNVNAIYLLRVPAL